MNECNNQLIIMLEIRNTVPYEKKGAKMGKNSKPANDLAIVSDSRDTLRNPDGHIDIAAYARIAHRERDAAIHSAVKETARSIRAISSAIWRALSRLGRIRSNAPFRG